MLHRNVREHIKDGCQTKVIALILDQTSPPPASQAPKAGLLGTISQSKELFEIGVSLCKARQMAVRSLSEVKQQLCRLVPGWVTATVRVALLMDRFDTARSLTLGNMHLHKHETVYPLSKTCASKNNPQFTFDIAIIDLQTDFES